jgi:hypothetical protein
MTGEEPVLVLSESTDQDSSVQISAFRKSSKPWIVAVRQVSEGVDIPRLEVLVYASRYRSPLFCHQAWGRVVRRRPPSELGGKIDDITASIYIPFEAELVAHATELERMLSYAVAEQEVRETTQAGDRTATQRFDLGSYDAALNGTVFAADGFVVDGVDIDALNASMPEDAKHLAALLIKDGWSPPGTAPQLHIEEHDPEERPRLMSKIQKLASERDNALGLDWGSTNLTLVKRYNNKRPEWTDEQLKEAYQWLLSAEWRNA